MLLTWRGGPRPLSRTTETNLDFAFVKNEPVIVVPKIESEARAPLSEPPVDGK